jgi:hypothetical protein
MIKELVLAIILGALLGFGLTGGFVAVQKSKTTSTTAQITPMITPQETISGTVTTPTTIPPEDTSTDNHQLIVESPENESIVANSQITIKGSTSPQSHLIITTPIKTYYLIADNAGNFSTDIEIESGINLIQMESIDSKDNQASAKIYVTYSTAKF